MTALAQPDLFTATIGDATYSDRAAFAAAAKVWRDGLPLMTMPYGPKRRSTDWDGTVPKSWNAETPAAQRKARECSPLTTAEREWLGQTVTDGASTGTVWSIAEQPKNVWVIMARHGGRKLVRYPLSELTIVTEPTDQAAMV